MAMFIIIITVIIIITFDADVLDDEIASEVHRTVVIAV